jgi:hypothetical protein
MALNGHPSSTQQCLLSVVKRTSKFKSVTSGFDPKRTLVAVGVPSPLVPKRHSLDLTTRHLKVPGIAGGK